MSKDEWVNHMRKVAGLTSILTDEDRRIYSAARQAHDFKSCPDCKARARNIRANRARIEKDMICRDMGLTKVRGALGGTYWE